MGRDLPVKNLQTLWPEMEYYNNNNNDGLLKIFKNNTLVVKYV